MKQQMKAVAVAVALSLSAAGALAMPVSSENGPDMVVNGGFESGLSGWTQVGNTGFTGVVGGGHSGSNYLSDGAVGSLGGVEQTLATAAGTYYNIHLWLSSDGGTPNEIMVQWNGSTVYDAVNVGSQGFTEIVIDPLGLGGDVLTVLARNDPGFLGIDDISVFATPEPASLALFGLGLAGLGFGRRKLAS